MKPDGSVFAKALAARVDHERFRGGQRIVRCFRLRAELEHVVNICLVRCGQRLVFRERLFVKIVRREVGGGYCALCGGKFPLLFAFFFVIGISFRYIIWRGARREAESGRKRNGYIVLAFFLLTYGVYAIVSFIYRAAVKGTDAQDVLKFVFDATSFAILCELISSAFRLRKVRDELKALGSGGEL